MPLIPEQMPPDHVKDVQFEDRLLDIELNYVENELPRDIIDSFWSNLYYAELSPLDRTIISSGDTSIVNYQLHVSDFDSQRQTIGVVIAGFLRYQDELCIGPVIHTTVTTSGAVISDNSQAKSKRYSANMKPHVASLLAVAEQNLTALDPDSFQY